MKTPTPGVEIKPAPEWSYELVVGMPHYPFVVKMEDSGAAHLLYGLLTIYREREGLTVELWTVRENVRTLIFPDQQ